MTKKNKRECKKAKGTCVFGKGKVDGPCFPKKKYKYECADLNDQECSDDDIHGGFCAIVDGECAHVCDGLERKPCKNVKVGKKKVCKSKRVDNPCKGCKPRSECDEP